MTDEEGTDTGDPVAAPGESELAEWWRLVLMHERMMLGTRGDTRREPAPAECRAEVQRRMHMPYHRLVRGSPESGYQAMVLEMPGCRTRGGTPVQALARLEGAMEDWLESRLLGGQALPDPAPAIERPQP